MTAPPPLSVLPAATRLPASRGGSSGGDGAPAFASALDDALSGSRSAPRSAGRAADRTPDRGAERAADRGAERAADRAADRGADRASERASERAADRSAVRRAGDSTPTPRASAPAAPADHDATAETAAEDVAAEDVQDGTTGATSVVLAPGLWALLAAAAPATVTSSVATSGTDPVGTGAVTGPVLAGGTPALPGTPLTGPPTAAPSTAAVPEAALLADAPAQVGTWTTPTVADLAAAAGLTVVIDPASSPAPAAAASPVATPGPTSSPVPAGDVPAALPVTTSSGTGSGADDAPGGQGPGLPGPAVTAPAADPEVVTPFAVPAPVTPAAPVAAAAPGSPAGPDTPVAAQLGRQLAVLHNAPNGSQTMTVVITPETLGPVTVAVTVTDGTLDLTLSGATDVGRYALLDALPELRRELESAGLTFDKLEVDTSARDSGTGSRSAQQLLADARAGQQGSSGQPGQQEPRPRTWGSAPDSPEGTAALGTDQSAPSGVDVRV